MKLVESMIGWEVTVHVTGQGQNDIRERDTSYCIIRSPCEPYNFPNDDFYPSLISYKIMRVASTLDKHMQVPNLDTTRCPEG